MSMDASIRDVLLKVKWAGEAALAEWGLILVVFLTATASFGLGQLSAREEGRPAITVREAPGEAEPKGMHIGGLVVASKKGTAYHYPWCSGASQIASTNQVWFETEALAKKAGYAPAKNCQGLGEPTESR